MMSRSTRAAFLVATLATVATSTPSAQDIPEIPNKELASLEGTARKLAKAGLRQQTNTLLSVLERLGHAERKLASARASCERDLAKPKHGKAKFSQHASSIHATAERLAGIMDATADDASKRALAQQIARLDDSIDRVNELLGYSRAENGSWVPAWRIEFEGRLRELETALLRAQTFPVAIDTSESSNYFLNQVLGRPGYQAAFRDIVVHTDGTAEEGKRLVTRAMRGLAVANWLLNGQLDNGPTRRLDFMFVRSKLVYSKVVETLRTEGALTDQQAASYANSVHFWDPRNEQFVKLGYSEDELVGFVMTEVLRDRPGFAPQPWLFAGLANWLTLAWTGQRMPIYNLSGTKNAAAGKKDQIDKDGNAGLWGALARVRSLLGNGRAPKLEDLMVGVVDDLQGNALRRATAFVDYLIATGPLDSIAKAVPAEGAADAKARLAQLTDALPIALDEIDERWQQLASSTGGASSVVASLRAAESGGAGAPAAFLQRLKSTRAAATKGLGAPQYEVDALLSAGAAQHAAYLASREDLDTSDGPSQWYQDPAHDAFTAGGARAGWHSLAARRKDSVEALASWLASYPSCMHVLHPGLLRIGWGTAAGGELHVLDCRSAVWANMTPGHVAWPHDGMKKVPLTYAADQPCPVPTEGATFGHPIALRLIRGSETPGGPVTMKLYDGSPQRSEPLDCHFVHPGSVVDAAFVAPDTYCLIPKTPLLKRTKYTVVFEFTEAPKQRIIWSFQT